MTKHGYENTSIGDIRTELEKDFGITDKDTLAQTKKPLVELLLRLKAEPHEDDESLLMDEDIFDSTEADALLSVSMIFPTMFLWYNLYSIVLVGTNGL